MTEHFVQRPGAIKRCPRPFDCRAELDHAWGGVECSAKDCNLIGWPAIDGELYNTPEAARKANGNGSL